ncbi:MAG TPA: beta-N-acetylhexosaminidase [Ktedonobacteraceae bacterium]
MPIDPESRAFAILPQPGTLIPGEGSFALTADTVIVADQETQVVAHLLADSLAPALGFAPQVLADAPADLPVLALHVDAGLARLGNEGYTLKVTQERVTIHAAAPAGVFYGTQTLKQLLPPDVFAQTLIRQDWTVPAVTIEDAPRFSWRGLMFDPSRHFFSKEAILKFIDLLALHKMNVLHLHLTDDQGWRIEIKKYPRLTEVGAWRKETVIGHARHPQGYDGTPHGGFYRQDELREIVAYAAARFVTVVPEIDLPGHARAAIAAYPDLGVTGEPVEVATTWGIFPYLYSPEESTLQFLRDVLVEVMDIFPGSFVHLGGDEAIKDQWQASPRVQERIRELGLKDEHELQSWFISQLGVFLNQHGRRLIGWDEILEGGLPESATVMSWRGIDGGIAAARAGHDVVMAPSTHVYFDHYQSNDPAEPLAIHGYTPLDKVYSFDPVPAELTPEQARHVLGTEGTLWSEYLSTAEQLEYMAFPRLIALAEVAWSARNSLDFAAFRRRLARHEERLAHLKVASRPVASWEKEQTYPLR